MASPPQIKEGLRSVMAMFWMITFFAPLAILSPFPLREALDPTPTSDLLEPTLMGWMAALSYVTLMVFEPLPALPFVHQLAWLMAWRDHQHIQSSTSVRGRTRKGNKDSRPGQRNHTCWKQVCSHLRWSCPRYPESSARS